MYFKFYVGVWWILCYGLPLSVIFAATIFYEDDFYADRFWSSLYVGFARPLFTFGIIFAVFGIAQGQGCKIRFNFLKTTRIIRFYFIIGIMKRILEAAPLQILGRISYCTYLVHTTLQRIRVGELRQPVYASEIQYVSYISE